MKSREAAPPRKSSEPLQSLTQALGQSERVKDIIAECATDLSSVNAGLKQELGDRDLLPGVENALEKSEAVEDKVQDASEELSAVNRALKAEVRERHILEDQLASVTRQGEEARHASLHDPLTGLPNRALFNDRLEHGVAQSKRHGFSFAVMFMDLDDFKHVNDTHGHEVGDQVLQEIARRLSANTRDADTVCRHGGDEFLYMLVEIQNEKDVVTIAEKLIAAVHAPCEIEFGSARISLCINPSIGIALFPGDGSTADALIARADKAMYRAKRTRAGYSFAADLSPD